MVRNTARVGEDKGRHRVEDQLGNLNTSVTLDQDRYVDVWNEQATRSEYFWLGAGISVNETNVGRLFANLTDDGANDVDGGSYRVVVYEDSDRDFLKAVGPEFGAQELIDSEGANRTDQIMLPLQNPGAREDQHIALQLKCDADNDGNTLDTANSTAVQIPYSAVRQRR